MPDKPADKPEAADPEVAALAEAIAGEPLAPTLDEGGRTLAEDKPVSQEKDTAPKDGEKPPVSEEKVEPKDGEKPDGEGDGEGEQEDPLKGLASSKTPVRVLLEHPILGPLLQSWSDTAGAAQVASALERERPTIAANAKVEELQRVEDEHFSGLTQEEIAEEISGDEEAATRYARYQQRKTAGAQPNETAVVQASQLYAYASEVSAIQGLLEGSGLTAEVKDSLKPDNFTHLKTEGIKEWKKAVFQAIVTQEAMGLTEKELDAKWEAYKQEHLAEVDGERPAIVGGRKQGPADDLMSTDSSAILEKGLADKEAQRAKAK